MPPEAVEELIDHFLKLRSPRLDMDVVNCMLLDGKGSAPSGRWRYVQLVITSRKGFSQHAFTVASTQE